MDTKEGRPIAILPFGDYKGFGLGLICDLLAGAAGGGVSLHEKTSNEGVYVNNMLSLVFDMNRLSDSGTRNAGIDAAIGFVAACRPSEDGPPRVPGDGSRATAEVRARDGIPIDAHTWAALVDVFAAHGMDILS